MAAKVNWPVAAALLLCYIIAFGLAVAAEEHRSQVRIHFTLNDSLHNLSHTVILPKMFFEVVRSQRVIRLSTLTEMRKARFAILRSLSEYGCHLLKV